MTNKKPQRPAELAGAETKATMLASGPYDLFIGDNLQGPGMHAEPASANARAPKQRR